jgi:hypothetical protein
MSGSVGTNSGRGSGTIGTASAGADTSLSNLTSAGKNHILQLFVMFTTSSGTPSIQDSNNVSSLTDNGVGNFTVNFSITTANALYGWLAASVADRVQLGTVTTTTAVINTLEYNTAAADPTKTTFGVLGD